MYSAGVLEVEPIQGCGRTHTRDNTMSDKQIQSLEPTEEIGCSSGIYAVPDTNQAARLHLYA